MPVTGTVNRGVKISLFDTFRNRGPYLKNLSFCLTPLGSGFSCLNPILSKDGANAKRQAKERSTLAPDGIQGHGLVIADETGSFKEFTALGGGHGLIVPLFDRQLVPQTLQGTPGQ
jgi:hypothetical protein